MGSRPIDKSANQAARTYLFIAAMLIFTVDSHGREADASPAHRRKEKQMLETIAVILIVLWLLGLVTAYTMGGFIHALLVIAIVVILLRVIQGRRL
jgi:hypothetical protein